MCSFASFGLERKHSNPDITAQRHLKNFTIALQEFVEAKSLLYYIEFGSLLPFSLVRECLSQDKVGSISDAECNTTFIVCPIKVMITEEDYLLGLADLTGELMRLVINHLSAGDQTQLGPAMEFQRCLSTGLFMDAGRVCTTE